jgi:glycosyltransferase involved in cell wall biosynthesis
MTPAQSQDPAALEAHRMAVWRDCLSLSSFWPPNQVGPQPAWLEHAPFAFWLIEALRPSTLVELGTHGGFSYFTFCQAVERLQLETRCFAVDTWRGDEHAGFYGEEVYEDVRRYHDSRHSSFSTLVRATFDDAVHQFPDGIIDLLHIDGRHLYNDVKHDFETWRHKLSDRSVVLFHDTNVHERDFGVFRFWRELCLEHPHFEFLHGHGLGIVGIGGRLPHTIDALLRASGDARAVSQIRGVYSRLGSTITLELVAREQKSELRRQESERRRQTDEAAALRIDLTRQTEEAEALRVALTRQTEATEARRIDLTRQTEETKALRVALTRQTEEAAALRVALTRQSEEAETLRVALMRQTEEAAALRVDLTRQTKEAEALRKDLARQAGEAETLRGTLAAIAAENTQFGSELTDARSRINELSGALKGEQLETHVMRTSTCWRITGPIRAVGDRYPRLARYGRRMLRRVHPGTGVDERGPVTNGHEGVRPGQDLDADFLEPYFRSAGFCDLPEVTVGRLREAGWPVYGTRAAAEAVAAMIRGTELFDAEEYAAQMGDVSGIDPLLHYVIVGDQMGLMPSKRFDPMYYRHLYPDIGRAAMNALAHYVTSGEAEGRRPLGVATGLNFDRSRIDPERETILLISHEASRTGAPILAYNIARRLGQKYNVVAVLLGGGELVPHFEAMCAAVVGPLTCADWGPVEAEYLVRRLTTSYKVFMAIANSVESRIVLPPLAFYLVPVVTLFHEFASYTRPEGAMGEALDWSTQVVFSAELVARAAEREHPALADRAIHVLRQGRCDVPARWEHRGPPARSAEDLARAVRPKEAEDALVVLGCGTVQIRKGVDLFLSCAAAVAASGTRRPVRFVWIGHGYDPRNDGTYSCYLADQIARSGLESIVSILDEVEDLEPAYRQADVFLLSSRLDPMPNVTIDAALHGMPVICFDDATGFREILGADPRTRRCVVPYLDVGGAARVIAQFADDEQVRREAGAVTRQLAETAFDMDRYVDRIVEVGIEAVRIVRQRIQDFEIIRGDALFDEHVYLTLDHPPVTRDQAILDYLIRWTTVGVSRLPATNRLFRRPCAGFHPQIYAHERAALYDATTTNPLADFIRRGKPDGPWNTELITLAPAGETAPAADLRVGLHAHFFYPELADDFMRKLGANRGRCDLLLSTDSEAKARILRQSTAGHEGGEVVIRVVPNRGRDLGPFLTEFAEEIARDYDVVGHAHAKRSLCLGDPRPGETWREFLWQNLLGDRHPAMDVIIGRFAADAHLGLVFPADPHLSHWDANLTLATELAARMGIEEPLPPYFGFPIGTMFWARPSALEPILALGLGWDDYPVEPVPIDGTILHVLERLLPFSARRAGYGIAATHTPGLTW